METLVKYHGGTRFSATCEGFTIHSGEGPDGDKTKDGMHPPQLMAAAVGMCVGRYVISYCQHHDIPHADLTIEVDRETAKAPARTTKIVVTVRLGARLSAKDADALVKVADQCHVTQTIRQQAEVVCRVFGTA